MVKKVFWENPYLCDLKANIVSINDNDITLDQTIFFAFSGGQESDTGTIGGYQVLEAKKEGLEIIYTLEDNHDLNVGDEVQIQIDWKRRYQLMKLHFAAEIILELCYQNLEGIEKIGAHISEDKARIDFFWHENISKSFDLLESKANQLISENRMIISAFSDEENERRYWEIKDFGKVSCGGTHIKKTAEIGNIKLKRVNIGKGKERIEIYLQ